jgi:hypothetical protein
MVKVGKVTVHVEADGLNVYGHFPNFHDFYAIISSTLVL